MKTTLQALNKKVKEISANLSNLLMIEERSKDFVCASLEDPEKVRPEYDFLSTQQQICEAEAELRRIKHIINVANTTTKVEGFDMTIDEVLIFIPQLSNMVRKLSAMRGKLKIERARSYSNIVEYTYINYDLNEVEQEYAVAFEKLTNLQMALDYTNNSTFVEV